MYIIGNALQEPRRCLKSPHMILIQKISGVMLQRSEQGLSSRFIQVKSHTGVEGNEIADKLAMWPGTLLSVSSTSMMVTMPLSIADGPAL